MKVAALLALPLALTAAKDDPLAKRLRGYVAEAPVNCIQPIGNTGPEVMDGGVIVFQQSGRRLWVTRPTGTCPSLRPVTTLIIQRFGAQLCRNDRFQVLDPGVSIPSGFCRFDRFTPYRKVARK